MTDARDRLDEVARRLGEARYACVLSDYDGTLAPLVEEPGSAQMPAPTRAVLERLAGHPRAILGIISGRALPDLRARIGLGGIWYVGNHGYEILSPRNELHRFYEPEDVRALDAFRDEMAQELAGVAGVIVEHKGPVVAVHYRRVHEAQHGAVERAFLRVIGRHHRRVMFARGNRVLEARLRGHCNKGTAVRWIRQTLPAGALIVYFGDDLTDRDAFRALQRVGISIQVGGDGGGLSDYTLPDPEAVRGLLEHIIAHLEARKGRPPIRGLTFRGGDTPRTSRT